MCDFESSGLCGWHSETVSEYNWIWASSRTYKEIRPDEDHSFESGEGHYMIVNSEWTPSEEIMLISPKFKNKGMKR